MHKTRLRGHFGHTVYEQVTDIHPKRPADLPPGASSAVAAGSVMPAASDLFTG